MIKCTLRFFTFYCVLGLTLAQIFTRTINPVDLTIGWVLALAIWLVEKKEQSL